MDTHHQHQAFLRSPRRNLLNITNHGAHGWQVVPGLPDTGRHRRGAVAWTA